MTRRGAPAESERQRVAKGTPLADRIQFHSIVDEHGCWIWQRKLDISGYARLTITADDGSQRSTPAHRASYEAFVGPIPDGLTIDHLCRVTRCVNPAHLEAVTHAENVRRGLGWKVGPTLAAEKRAALRAELARRGAA